MPYYYPSEKQIQNLFAFLNDNNNYLRTSRDITQFITQFTQAPDSISACFYAHQESYLDFRAEFPRILYVLSGHVTAWLDPEQQYELTAGHLIFANADTHIEYESHASDTKIVSIYIKREFINEKAHYFAQSNGQMENYVFANFGLLNAQTDPLILQIPTDSDANFSILFLSKFILSRQHAMIFPIFLWMLTNLDDYLPHLPNGQSSQHILQLIDRELTSISLESLAQELGYSPSYTSKMIRKNFHMTFQEIVMEKKIERAKWLLTHSTESIHIVSENVGFADKSYFYKLFKQKVGMTPKQYRQVTSPG
ncbi:AraC family transcriptional regulator [Weissella viridescens]|uniref:AraC family transcriptional regulator n=1 Tax=Weissella viridescens TaxID=1629 RepID=A0A3P2RBT5_WEIVI|nr:helix-turn-helix domain-containing protein [Weissella viridescens]RRG18043.1 AraC family transcriptional regulator [Weissella viridescens]